MSSANYFSHKCSQEFFANVNHQKIS